MRSLHNVRTSTHSLFLCSFLCRRVFVFSHGTAAVYIIDHTRRFNALCPFRFCFTSCMRAANNIVLRPPSAASIISGDFRRAFHADGLHRVCHHSSIWPAATIISVVTVDCGPSPLLLASVPSRRVRVLLGERCALLAATKPLAVDCMLLRLPGRQSSVSRGRSMAEEYPGLFRL